MDGYQRRKRQSRDSILRAAIELFAARGIRRVSVAEVAKKAGVNPVTIYNHFQDKDGLVREAVTRLAMDHWSRFRAILEGDSPFVEKLERVVALKREMADRYSSELVRSAISADPQIRRAVGSLFENQVNPLLLKFLKSGQREGAVRRDLSINALRIYLDMFTDVARAHPELFEGAKRPSKITREVWNLFLHGIGGGTGSR
jgi:AcrR family transcriptional regulator